MTASRERTPRAAALPLSAALLLARSFALVALAAVALLVALAAWFAVKAALAVDPVVGTERVWLQYGHHRPPYAYVKLDPLKYTVPGPAYDVSLEATLPVNENNLRLGNFMVSLSLVDSLGSRAVNVSRPAILNPSSLSSPDLRNDRTESSVSIIRTLATLPLALIPTPFTRCLSSPAETHLSTVLQVPLLENVALASTPHVAGRGAATGGRRQSRWKGFTSRGERRGRGPVDTIFVEIGRRDTYPLTRGRQAYAAGPTDEKKCDAVRHYSQSHQPPGRELQVYEAWIKVQVKPKGLRALVHRHPWITFLFFFPTFLTLEATAALAIYLYFVATAPSSSARDSLEAESYRRRGDEDLQTTLSFGSGSGATSPAATTTANESEPLTSATPSDYDHLSDDSEVPHGAEEEEVAAAARLEERRRQESMRLGRGGVGMSAASLGGGGGGGRVEAEAEETESEEEEVDRASESGEGGGGGGETLGFGLEGMEEAEWIKGEDEEGASTVAASATTRRTASTFGPSVAGSTSSSSAAATGVSWPISRARQREQAPRFSGRVDEADEADL